VRHLGYELSLPSPSKAQDGSIGQAPETRPKQRVPQSRGVQTAKKIIKFLLPKRVLQEVAQYRKYKRVERPLYLKVRTLDALGLRNRKGPENLARVRSFLFVCSGNIMRSPMCEALMRQELTAIPQARVTVTSAGLNASTGKLAHPWGLASAAQYGVSLEAHRARLLTLDMVDQADVIFAMDYHNQVELLSRYPGARERVFMLSAYAGDDYRAVEIRDPFYGDEEETRCCYGILQTCVRNLVSTLASQVPQPDSETLAGSTSRTSQ
jgi:protein-tyrosine phosphatase